MPDLSVIVPVFNEAENVVPLAREVQAALTPLNRPWELVLVDDGSRDETWQRIADAQREIPAVRGLRLARNSGQSAALWTGLQHTTSPLIATLDGDRQNDPADIPRLLRRLEEAPCDFVCGHRTNRRDNWRRLISTRIARAARSVVLQSELADVGCQMRVFRRSVIDGLFGFNGLHRFLPILVQGGGFGCLRCPWNIDPAWRVSPNMASGIGCGAAWSTSSPSHGSNAAATVRSHAKSFRRGSAELSRMDFDR